MKNREFLKWFGKWFGELLLNLAAQLAREFVKMLGGARRANRTSPSGQTVQLDNYKILVQIPEVRHTHRINEPCSFNCPGNAYRLKKPTLHRYAKGLNYEVHIGTVGLSGLNREVEEELFRQAAERQERRRGNSYG